MSVLDFILGLIAIIALFIFGIGALGMKYNSLKLEERIEKLEEENQKLKEKVKNKKETKKDVK